MKITHINKSVKFPVKISVKDGVGKDVVFSMKVGDVLYCSNETMTHSLIIFQKKRIISIEKGGLPDGFKWYNVYTDVEVSNPPTPAAEDAEETEEIVEGGKTITSLDRAMIKLQEYKDKKKAKKKAKKKPGKSGRPKKRGTKKGTKKVQTPAETVEPTV